MIAQKIKNIFNYIKRIKVSRMLLSFMNNGYLIETGWLQNFNNISPVDINMNPIPWTTYSFIYFIRDYLKPEMELFEYGSGNSTLFFASLINHVYSVEHDLQWYNKLKTSSPVNCTVLFRNLDDGYENAIAEPKLKFNVIFIDGRRRNKCMYKAVKYIQENGIIVLDDSERAEYEEGIQFLTRQGFRKIDFWGISHRYFHNKATTVFYKIL